MPRRNIPDGEPMTPEEAAIRLSSASNYCGSGKCPYYTECDGTRNKCRMNEVSLMLRSLVAENKNLSSKLEVCKSMLFGLSSYINECEDMNREYWRMIKAFEKGYRPRTPIRKLKRKKKRVRDEDRYKLDGDKRYEMKTEYEPNDEVLL